MYSPISSLGKRYLSVFVILLSLDVVAVALAARVNIFQEFYFMADLFPLGLSIATLIVLCGSIVTDVVFYNSVLSRPAFKVGMCFVLSIFWLAFNIFSTLRWRDIPLPCSSVPAEYAGERAWCYDVQALKSFVWLFFVGVFLTGIFTLRYTIIQHQSGNRHVWKCSLVRFDPYAFEMITSRRPTTSTDYFASSTGNAISGPPVDPKW